MSTTSHSPFLREAVRLLASAPMRSLARRICPRDYEDVLQDAAIKCVEFEQRHPGFEARNVAALLHVIVRHEALRIVDDKRKRTRPVVDPAMADAAPSLFPTAAFEGDDGEIVASVREPDAFEDRRAVLVLAAVEKLSPDHRREIGSTFWHEIPIRNTRLRGVPHGTAVSRVSRAKAQLRAMPEIAEARRLRVG